MKSFMYYNYTRTITIIKDVYGGDIWYFGGARHKTNGNAYKEYIWNCGIRSNKKCYRLYFKDIKINTGRLVI